MLITSREMKRRTDSTSSSEEGEEEESEASCFGSDRDWLWEKLFILCYNKTHYPLVMLKGYI